MNKRVVSYIVLIIAAILWGTSYTVVKIGLSVLSPPLPPLGYLALRFFLALVFLFPICFSTKNRLDVYKLVRSKYVVFLGFVNGFSYSVQFLGQEGTSAGIATLMVNTYLFSTPILSAFILGTIITKKMKIAVVVGMSGVLVVSWSSLSIIHEDMFIFVFSTLLVFLSGMIWGGYSVLSSIISDKAKVSDSKEFNNPLAVFFSSNFYSVILIAALMIILGQYPSDESLTINAWIVILYLAIFCTLIPFVLYIFASQEIQPTNMNIVLLLNIIVSLVFANIVLSESLSLLGIFGSVGIIYSIYLASTSHYPKETSEYINEQKKEI